MDTTPITFEWLASQATLCKDEGYWDVPPSGDVWWEVGCISFTCEAYQSDPGEPTETLATDWQVDGEKLPKALVPKTRSQFRQLAQLANGATASPVCDMCNGTGFPGTTEMSNLFPSELEEIRTMHADAKSLAERVSKMARHLSNTTRPHGDRIVGFLMDAERYATELVEELADYTEPEE